MLYARFLKEHRTALHKGCVFVELLTCLWVRSKSLGAV
jgi:hypothetical protein